MRRVLLVVVTMVFLTALSAFAQDASLVGTVADETKAVLPGATVTATNLETGVESVAVSDERGDYRLPKLSPGKYKVKADLAGFGSIVVPSVELLVGQNAAVPFTLRIASVGEELTVTGEAPLVDITSSQVSGNVDRRQMEQLPLQGRNWLELSMMVKGITANNVSNQPGVSNDDFFQLNLDGQQITQKLAGSGFGQPAFSRDAIAEFQIVTSQFDITQGRSAGMQVQAISKSGTNKNSGSLYGFFRDDAFNAPDNVAKTVLPYSDQQIGGTFGGPIVKDRLHYFFSYEYERQPGTIFTQPQGLSGQSFTFPTKTT
ncbi:MAG TPA: carboxypeptidase-like regulatory domain-containing protein, partial [Vicinamibacterales bacterium]|nr:carboxypeptidase-like regulatory domain-containing protein [Vicinamibacterales bacterium]